jgi:hypothetical protein
MAVRRGMDAGPYAGANVIFSDVLNRRPALSIAISSLIIVGVGFLIWFFYFRSKNTEYLSMTWAYYTVDDGATWFQDDANKVAPFEKDGKEAVRCHVYCCKETRERWAAWLEKWDESAKKEMDGLGTDEGNTSQRLKVREQTWRALIKKPGANNKWVPMAGKPINEDATFEGQGQFDQEGERINRDSAQITQMWCPKHKDAKVREVFPGDE